MPSFALFGNSLLDLSGGAACHSSIIIPYAWFHFRPGGFTYRCPKPTDKSRNSARRICLFLLKPKRTLLGGYSSSSLELFAFTIDTRLLSPQTLGVAALGER